MDNGLTTIMRNLGAQADSEKSSSIISSKLNQIALNTENTTESIDSHLFILITLLKKSITTFAKADQDSTKEIIEALNKVLVALMRQEHETVSVDNLKDMSDPLKQALEQILIQLKNQKAPVVNIPETVVNVKASDVTVPAPVVNVPAPIVNIPAPIVNVPKQTINVPPTDLMPLIKELKYQLNKLSTNGVDNPLAVRLSDGADWIDELKALTEKMADAGEKVSNSASNMSVWTTSSRAVFLRNAFGIRINPKTEDSYALRVDDATTTNITYVGKAAIGASSSEAKWSIKKIDQTGSPVTTVITYANGNNMFNNVWDNRTSLTYL